MTIQRQFFAKIIFFSFYYRLGESLSLRLSQLSAVETHRVIVTERERERERERQRQRQREERQTDRQTDRQT